MPRSSSSRSTMWRVVGATFFAVVLWAIVSLSEEYEVAFDMRLRVDLPPTQALTEPIPPTLRVTLEATGWALLKLMVGRTPETVIRPAMGTITGERSFGIGSDRLLERVGVSVPGPKQLSVYPDTVTISVGPVSTKKVPLHPEVTIGTRKGFQVIGTPRLQPDSIVLVGAQKVLKDITVWPTAPLVLQDVHRSVSQWAPVSDTLQGIITPQARRVELIADVQEIGERTFVDIPLIERVTLRDTTLTPVLHPERIEVLLRGGVVDLSRLDPDAIRAFVEITEGTDTMGVVHPRLLLPSGLNVSVVRIKPQTIRYFFRRERE